jgi:hypothetical protein
VSAVIPITGASVVSQPIVCLPAIHAGHHQVEQDDARRQIGTLLQGLVAAEGTHNIHPGIPDDDLNQVHRIRVVIDDQCWVEVGRTWIAPRSTPFTVYTLLDRSVGRFSMIQPQNDSLQTNRTLIELLPFYHFLREDQSPIFAIENTCS